MEFQLLRHASWGGSFDQSLGLSKPIMHLSVCNVKTSSQSTALFHPYQFALLDVILYYIYLQYGPNMITQCEARIIQL